MPGDLEPLPPVPLRPGLARVRRCLRAGLLGRVREQVLVAAWLTGLRSVRTRRAYAGDVVAWLSWLAGRGTGATFERRVLVERADAA